MIPSRASHTHRSASSTKPARTIHNTPSNMRILTFSLTTYSTGRLERMLDYVVVVQMEQDAGRINRRAVLVDGLRVRETQPIHACYLADASLQERGIVTANSLDVPPMFAKKLFIYLGAIKKPKARGCELNGWRCHTPRLFVQFDRIYRIFKHHSVKPCANLTRWPVTRCARQNSSPCVWSRLNPRRDLPTWKSG